jgi:hypothetical protein
MVTPKHNLRSDEEPLYHPRFGNYGSFLGRILQKEPSHPLQNYCGPSGGGGGASIIIFGGGIWL